MAKYDWQKLRQKFVTGNYSSLKDFAEREKMDYYNVRKNAKGWLTEKATRDTQKGNKIIDKIIDRQAERAVAVNERHLMLFDKILDLLENATKDTESLVEYVGNDTESRALKLMAETVDKIQRGQRLALDMDKEVDKAYNADDNAVEELSKALRERGVDGEYED